MGFEDTDPKPEVPSDEPKTTSSSPKPKIETLEKRKEYLSRLSEIIDDPEAADDYLKADRDAGHSVDKIMEKQIKEQIFVWNNMISRV